MLITSFGQTSAQQGGGEPCDRFVQILSEGHIHCDAVEMRSQVADMHSTQWKVFQTVAISGLQTKNEPKTGLAARFAFLNGSLLHFSMVSD